MNNQVQGKCLLPRFLCGIGCDLQMAACKDCVGEMSKPLTDVPHNLNQSGNEPSTSLRASLPVMVITS